MAQGDSISGTLKATASSQDWDIRPPVGQVWLITFFKFFRVDDRVYLTNGAIENEITDLKSNPNIKIFINNNLFLRVFCSSSLSYFVWSGVQFK